jgi:hypothetical protein
MNKVIVSVFIFTITILTLTYSLKLDNYTYAVVISETAYNEAGWKEVADSLLKKHGRTGSRLITWKTSINEVKPDLASFMPTYIGFIARPVIECNSSFIASVSQLTRNLDTDPYGDGFWGVITGYKASDALRAISEPLLIKTTVLASERIAYEPPLQRYYQAVGLPCDSYTKTDYLFANTNGQVYSIQQRPDNQRDRSKIMAKWLNAQSIELSVPGKGSIKGPVDCVITGGHGNVNLWQMHYDGPGTEGFLVSSDGQLFARPYSGNSIAINSPAPRIFWHVSNCLMGSPDKKNNWVYAAFHTGHAVQMFGFIPPASMGDEFMAWGLFDRVTKFAGKYTLPQGHFITNNCAQFELRHPTGFFHMNGVQRYMDSTVVYGDPAADVNFIDMEDSSRVYAENFTYSTGTRGISTFEYSVTALAHTIEFGKGYCYQFRPVYFMPVRINPSTVTIIRNDGSTAEITDNLVLWEMLTSGKSLKKGSTKKLIWTADIIDKEKTPVVPKPDNSNGFFVITISEKTIKIQTNSIPFGKTKLFVNDISGKQVMKSDFYFDGSRYETAINRKELTPGFYMATVKHKTNTIVKPFLVMNTY